MAGCPSAPRTRADRDYLAACDQHPEPGSRAPAARLAGSGRPASPSGADPAITQPQNPPPTQPSSFLNVLLALPMRTDSLKSERDGLCEGADERGSPGVVGLPALQAH